MISSAELLRLDPDELAERLVRVAQEARKCTEDGRELDVAELLKSIRDAGDEATGARLALLEVSEAFLRALARSDLGKTEVALRRFALAQEDGGASTLGPLAGGGSMAADAFIALGDWGQQLVDVGVLRALPGGRHDLRPSLRLLARDLVEPAVFRSWRRVSSARANAGLGRMNETQTAAYFAGELGVTPQQATMHLRLSPIATSSDSQYPVPGPVRQAGPRVVYSRSASAHHGRPAEAFIRPSTAAAQADAAVSSTLLSVVGNGAREGAWS